MEGNVTTDINNMGLSDIAKGVIRFSIKADDTQENSQVHQAFKEFCKVETDNNYTQGIRKLLEYYQNDFKYELLVDKITKLEVTLLDLTHSVKSLSEKPQESNDENGAF